VLETQQKPGTDEKALKYHETAKNSVFQHTQENFGCCTHPGAGISNEISAPAIRQTQYETLEAKLRLCE